MISKQHKRKLTPHQANGDKPVYDQLTWQQVRSEVSPLDPRLTKIIDAIKPSDEHLFIRVKYPFGANVIIDGKLQLPSEQGCLPLTHASVPLKLQQALNYQALPLGIIMKGSLEVVHKFQQRIFSLAFFKAGFDFGAYETFAERVPFDGTAGARSLFLLPKITDAASHNSLRRKFIFRADPPQHCFEHWQIFTELANSAHFYYPWHCEILFFNHAWFRKNEDLNWLAFRDYTYEKAWRQTAYSRQKAMYEFIWKSFYDELAYDRVKINGYVEDTLRHLIFVALGVLPGVAPVNNSEVSGPINGLQKAYLEVYRLKNYAPTLLEPCYFNVDDARPVYYSLQCPTLVTINPITRNNVSVADDLRNLKVLLDRFIHHITHKIDHKSKIVRVLEGIQFDFFHADAGHYGGIQNTSSMPDADPALMQCASLAEPREFCYRSSFVRGCVRMQAK